MSTGSGTPSADLARPPRQWRQRLARLVVAGLAVGSGAVVGIPQASAATIDEGTLTLGVRTVLTSTDWDTHVYRVTVPANQRLVLTKEESDAPFDGNVRIYDDGTGASVQVGDMSNTSAFARRAVEVAPVTAERLLRVEVEAHGAGVLPFTPLGVIDPSPRAVTWNTPEAVTIEPYQQATLTFSGVAGRRMGVAISGSTFAAGGVVVTVEGPSPFGGGLTTVYTVGTSYPPIMNAVDYQVRINGDDGAAGSLTVTMVDVVDVTGVITLGEPVTAEIDTVWTQVSQTFAQVAGARLRFEVLSSTLSRSDGTPGSAQANLVRRIGFFTLRTPLATIGASPLSTVIDSPMPEGEGTFEIIPDGASTGTITYRLSAQVDNPPVPAVLGEPIAVDLSQVYNSRSYTFDADAGQRFTIELSDISLTEPAGGGTQPLVSIVDGATGISTSLPQVVSGQASYSAVYTAAGATSLTLLFDPYLATTGSLTLTIRPVVDATVALEPGVTTIGTIPDGGGALYFTYGGTDSPGLPAITVEGSTLVDADGNRTNARLSFEQDGLAYGGTYSDGVGITERYSFLPPAELDPRRPWRLRAEVLAGASGSLSLSLRPPTVTAATVSLGVVTTVRFEGVADRTELTFQARAGQRIVVERRPGTILAGLELLTADGQSLGVSSDPDYAEFVAPTTSQPLVLVVRPGATTNQAGSVPVVIRQVWDPRVVADGATTVRWRLGQNPRLVFDGKRGQRIALSVSSMASVPSWRPVDVSLVDSRGQVLGYVTSLQSGNTFVDTDIRLPADGRYALVFDPRGESVGSLVATVRPIDDLRRNVTLGATTPLTFSQEGQRAYLRVRVAEGTRLDWSIPRAPLTGTLTLLQGENPVGSAHFGPELGGTLSYDALPAGTYTVVVDPSSPPTGRMSLRLTAQ